MMTSRRSTTRRTVLSLYTGAGGLDLGLEAAGFEPVFCVEIDEDARQTIAVNRPRWQLAEPGDIHKIRAADLLEQAKLNPGELSLLSAGPPCQPFSKSGYWCSGDAQRLNDPRAETIFAYLAVVEATLPRALILENVRGIAFSGKNEGLLFIQQGLEAINRRKQTNYSPRFVTLNAADYGVPQTRERVFVVASTPSI
ncbi:MAG: DNA (cytosine-5-)-methyltransferase [Candidatus Thiodiazotropha sp. (ex Dulcina madagascariensis)]|nr:DNA (cytosine-5-)-methyltransferase [Candidatus Thiodiazotropha sp. (ex Dulcina madagascariensis)]